MFIWLTILNASLYSDLSLRRETVYQKTKMINKANENHQNTVNLIPRNRIQHYIIKNANPNLNTCKQVNLTKQKSYAQKTTSSIERTDSQELILFSYLDSKGEN